MQCMSDEISGDVLGPCAGCAQKALALRGGVEGTRALLTALRYQTTTRKAVRMSVRFTGQQDADSLPSLALASHTIALPAQSP